jgi:hypothetical protein
LRRRTLGKLARVVIGVLLALVITEGALRLFGEERPILYEFDDELGWAPRPGAEGLAHEEGRAYVRINAAGFRDRDHALEAPPGTFRIAALGDSYTDAYQVELEATWWHRLESELSGCAALGGRRIEAMDFGVRGYGTAQELLTWRRAARRNRPDLVVLLYTPENDLVESVPELSAKAYLAPFFVFEGERFVLHPPTNGATFLGVPRASILRATFAARRRSRLLAAIDFEQLWYAVRDDARASTRFHAPADPELERIVTYAQSYGPFDSPELVSAWRVTDRLIEVLRSEVEGSGSVFVLVTASSPIQTYPDVARRRAFMEQIGVSDLYASERHVVATADRLGVASLALGPIFGARTEATHEALHGFPPTGLVIGHWNEAGHAAAATEIARTICERMRAPTERAVDDLLR